MCGAGAKWMGLKVTGIAGRVTKSVLRVTQGRACGEMVQGDGGRLCWGVLLPSLPILST